MDILASENTLYYYNDNWQVLEEFDITGAVITAQRYFVYGNYIDEVLMMVDVDGTNSVADGDYYYAHDHLYGATALMDSFVWDGDAKYTTDQCLAYCYAMGAGLGMGDFDPSDFPDDIVDEILDDYNPTALAKICANMANIGMCANVCETDKGYYGNPWPRGSGVGGG